MKERDRQRITECLQHIDEWRASAMALKPYCEAHGHNFVKWRAWLGVEGGWRKALAPPSVPPGFVQAVRAGTPAAPAAPVGAVMMRITVQRGVGALHATIDGPHDALRSCAALLREVLA